MVAHRGGIVEGKYNEFDPASIRTAIDQGYTIPKLARGEDIACHYFLFENGHHLTGSDQMVPATSCHRCSNRKYLAVSE